MGADKSAKNTPNVSKCMCPNCQPKRKSLGFQCKYDHEKNKKNLASSFLQILSLFVKSFRHFLDIQKQRVKLFCLLVRPWGIQARHGVEAGGVIYAHKNAVKSKECILRTPTTCKHAYILPHNMYEMMENNDQIAAATLFSPQLCTCSDMMSRALANSFTVQAHCEKFL